jgi:hypothetical protein
MSMGYEMRALTILVRIVIPGLLTMPMAEAGTITFDESPAADDGSAYNATILGVTFSATNAGVWGGNGNGNPGNWQLQGTNGSQFLGFNGAPYSETLTFVSPVDSFSADFARAAGSSDGTITLSAFDGSTLLGSTTGTLGAINTWSTLSLSLPGINKITWSDAGTGFSPYGVDNLNFTSSPISEPGSVTLLGLGLGLLIFTKGRARRVLSYRVLRSPASRSPG